MEQENKWSNAAMDGLYLSLVTIIYSLLIAVMQPESFIISTLMWLVKFSGCMYLLWFFMKRWSDRFETISYSHSYHYGFIVCLFSSIMCACYSYIQIEWLFPELSSQSMEMVKETMAAQGRLDSNTENMMDSIMNNFGRLSMFVSLFYYIIFGSIAAAITANFTKRTNPFAGEEQE